MIAPQGFRPVLEVDRLAHDLSQNMMNDLFSDLFDRIPHKEGSPEHFAELQLLVNDIAKQLVEKKYSITDQFLNSVSKLFVASHEGCVLEISKTMVLPDQSFFFDQDDYLANRNDQYACIDTELWVVDCEKLSALQARTVKLAGEHGLTEGKGLYTHARYFEHLQRFDGWSLCISENDFPSTPQELKQVLSQEDSALEASESVKKQILAVTEDRNITKATVREFFPHLSVRQFDHFWRLAAEIRPELSKPGRKS